MGERLMYVDHYSMAAGTRMTLVQTGQKCGVGDFSVKRQGSCAQHSLAPSGGLISNGALRAAAEAVVRAALDRVDVHPCDANNDEVRSQQLDWAMRALYASVATSEPTAQI